MKNIWLCLLMLFAFGGLAQANYELSTGNVGINTASPNDVLGVGGNMAVGNATYTTTAAPVDGAIIQGNVGIG